MDTPLLPPQVQAEKNNLSLLIQKTPEMQRLLEPMAEHSILSEEVCKKIRRLYLQAQAQQWFAPYKIPYHFSNSNEGEVSLQPPPSPSSSSITLTKEQQEIWQTFMTIFYTLEKMGLNVIINMMPKAIHKLRSEDASYYLSVQCFDESRHVFSIENYLKQLGAPPKYNRKLHILGQVASLGFYRVENWLFSTLFSENFASCFLRYAKSAVLDDTGVEMCKTLLMDESRHLHFLHIILPELMDRLSFLGKTYVKMSQFFIMKFTEQVSRSFAEKADMVGINRRDLMEDVFTHVERAYQAFGVNARFLPFPKIKDPEASFKNVRTLATSH